MNKYFFLFFILILCGCSLDTKSGLWTKTEKISNKKNPIIIDVNDKTDILEKEFNKNLKIKLKSGYKTFSFIENLTNNNGHLNFEGNLKKISKYKFSKIKNFKYSQPDLLLTKKRSIIFFNNKGTILNFDNDSNLLWKKNFYNKNERKMNPIVYFSSKDNNLVAADNLANYYALNIENGNLLWKFRNSAPFNSQVKIYEDKIFVIDFENILRCYSLKNGKELWNFKTEKSFIKSQQKLSLIIYDRAVIFNNTLGDITSVDIETGNLIWQTPTQSNTIYENAFSLKSSDLVLENNSIFFSNNKNEFFAINVNNGQLIWKNNINSNLRPTIIDNLVVTVSMEGFLIITDSSNGNIIRITNIFDRFNNKKKQIKPTGFIVAKNKIYISLNNGKLVVANMLDGKSLDIIKIDGNKISRPYILSKNLYVIKDNAILKIN